MVPFSGGPGKCGWLRGPVEETPVSMRCSSGEKKRVGAVDRKAGKGGHRDNGHLLAARQLLIECELNVSGRF